MTRMEHIALRWLAWERKCLAVMHERTPREWTCGHPDVIGLTRARYLYEIEIKRTLSDFRANKQKRHVVNRYDYLVHQPRQFYFFVPENIAAKCLAECPEWAGLARAVENCNFTVVKPAPVNHASKRLSVKECVKFFHLLSNQVVSFSSRLDSLHQADNCRQNWEHANDLYYWSYSI